MKRLIIVFITICFAFPLFAQQVQIKGKVSSTDGEELIGVNVFVEGTTNGTMTDIEGRYTLNVKTGDKVIYSYIGFNKEERIVRTNTNIDVRMAPDMNTIDDVVVVGYAETKRITLTGAVSTVSAREIRTVPTANVQNALYGKLPGFFAQQRSGQPGKDASDFFIRGVSSLNTDTGNQPLIIVDDVQYTYDQLQQININEVESISILKDASTTAIYGIKGANGVLVIKTRRGSTGKPQITVRAEAGLQSPVRTPKFLGSYDAATLINEAYQNDGRDPMFSAEDMRLFQTGESPYTHPDVNWYDEIFKNLAFQENVNLDISGGTDRVRYFIAGGFFHQNGLVRDFKDPQNEVNNNYFYKRYNFRSNLDFKVTSTTNMRLDITTRFMNINEPNNMNAVGEIYNYNKMRPFSAPVINPDGSYAYHDFQESGHDATLNAKLANNGYRRSRRFDANILYDVNQDLGFITKGLSATLRVAYSSINEDFRRVTRENNFPTYKYHPDGDYYTVNPSNKRYSYGTYEVFGDQEKSIKDVNIQAFLNYNKTINQDHNLILLALFNRQSRTVDKDGLASAQVPENFQGFSGAFHYDYKNKYLVDVNLAYNGTDRFGNNNRYGFFPAIGLGYNIAQEDFFRDRFSNVQLLKVRFSAGLVGSDAAPGGRYVYKHSFKKGDGYRFGNGGKSSGNDTYKEESLGNPYATWEKARKFNLGFDGNMFDKFSFMIDFFYDYRYDQLVRRGDVSQIVGIEIAPTNIGETTNKGFDGQINYQDKFGDVFFNSTFVIGFAKNKIKYKAEAQKLDRLSETGKSIGQMFGYTFDGYYTEEEVAQQNLPFDQRTVSFPAGLVYAGDLKYKDLNGDGVIDDLDRSAIGKPNLPNTTMGLNLSAMYKNVTLSVLLQGSFNYSFSVINEGIEPFKSQWQPVHMNRWTQERWDAGEKIEYPRLTTNTSSVNSPNAYMSDYWLINAAYLRLKTVDLSYQFPEKYLPQWVSHGKVYVNAYNLFTWTNFSKYQQDPEIKSDTSGDSYMNQRVINFGVMLTF